MVLPAPNTFKFPRTPLNEMIHRFFFGFVLLVDPYRSKAQRGFVCGEIMTIEKPVNVILNRRLMFQFHRVLLVACLFFGSVLPADPYSVIANGILHHT